MLAFIDPILVSIRFHKTYGVSTEDLWYDKKNKNIFNFKFYTILNHMIT